MNFWNVLSLKEYQVNGLARLGSEKLQKRSMDYRILLSHISSMVDSTIRHYRWKKFDYNLRNLQINVRIKEKGRELRKQLDNTCRYILSLKEINTLY